MIAFQFLPVVELRGHARSWKLLKDHGPVRRIPGVLPGPKRGGGGQGLKVTRPGDNGVDDGQNLVSVLNPDVDVDAIKEHLTTPVLGALHEVFVPDRISDSLIAWTCEWVGACSSKVGA